MKHSPLPWVKDNELKVSSRFIRDLKGKIIIYLDDSIDQAEINREFVLEACNNYEEVIKALEISLQFIERHERNLQNIDEWGDQEQDELEMINKALKRRN